MMLAMTHRYIFLLAETASQMFESRESRTVGVLDRATQRRHGMARTAGVLLSKSMELSNEVFLAMQSRGFRGDAHVLVEFRMRWRDYLGARRHFSLVGGARRVDGTVMSATARLRMPQNVDFEYERIPALRRAFAGDRARTVGRAGRRQRFRQVHAAATARCACVSRRLGRSAFAAQPLTAETARDDELRPVVSPPRGAGLSESRRAALQSDRVRRSRLRAAANGLVEQEVIDRVNHALELMGIAHLRDRPPYRLSGGEKKRVALASVIVLDPEVLLLDEPTAMLDPRSQSQLIDLIQNWKSTSKTIITATHQLEIVEDIADRVCRAGAGKCHRRRRHRGTSWRTASCCLRANLVHAHRHRHGDVMHSHPHLHSHGEHKHELTRSLSTETETSPAPST